METGAAGSFDQRALRREFQAISSGTKRLETPEAVIATYTAPLIRIFGEGCLPDTLRLSSHAAVASGSTERVDVLLVEAVQESLLSRVAIDWAEAMDAAQLHELVDVWLFGPLATGEREVERGMVQQCTLRTVSRLLAAPELHALVVERLTAVCVSALTRLSPPSLVAAVVAERNAARANVSWTETLRLLAALPDRLANATRGKLPPGFTPSIWLETVLVSGISTTLSQPTVDTRRIELLAEALGRLDRLGYLSRPVDTEGHGFWPTYLACSLQSDGAQRNWPRLRAKLSRDRRAKLDLGLVGTLQYLVVRNGALMGLVTPAESGKPGTEGTAFLGKSTHGTVAATALVLETFLGSGPVEDDGGSSDSDDESDDSGTAQCVKIFKTLALARTPQSPALAWAWSAYLSNQPATDLLSCLESTLELWADKDRVRRSIMSEELFLTTLVVCLLASIPPSSTSTPSIPSASSSTSPELTRLAAVSRSRAVLDGVSVHLEHSDGSVRRLGMLVAELLSARSPAGGKTLSFGSGVWNGTGEGREEARVLRALTDAWPHHAAAIRDVRDKWGTQPLAEALRCLGIHPSDTKATASVGGRGEIGMVVKKARSSGPKTRALPHRVAAPPRGGARARPLITMIGSDDDDDEMEGETAKQGQPSLLNMFSTAPKASRHSAPSDSSASSSDESDSDNGSEQEIHRLAATLSGLSPTEAADALSNTPLSSLSPSSKSSRQRPKKSRIDDFDADREAHAPQFDKPTPPPVYVSQLAPLLKSPSRAQIRLALHHASPLIRRKSSSVHFGGEVRENAVDLTLALVALHDNFGIRKFEPLRRAALVALAVGVPGVVVGVLSEQLFGSQYSGVQRSAMLVAIVESALELSGKMGEPAEGEGLGGRADVVVGGVIAQAKAVGEERVPAVRRERSLHVAAKKHKGGGLIEVLDPTSRRGSQPMVPATDEWQTIVAPTYIFPLVNRFLAYHAFARSTHTRGAGTAALFAPDTLSALLDTLTILLPLTPPHTVPSMTASLLEVVAAVLPLPTTVMRWGVHTASALNLLAVTLHAHLESTSPGNTGTMDGTAMAQLRTLAVVTQEIFTQLHAQGGETRGKGGDGLSGKIMARAAAVLLLLDQLDARHQEAVRRAIGFVPA